MRLDRGRQLGPLRARVDQKCEALRPLLQDGAVLYAEWLWLSHTVVSDRLPDHMIVLDVLRPGTGFVPVTERDELNRRGGLRGPPRLFAGILRTAEVLFRLIGRSRFGSSLMEGVVLRRDDGQACKVVRPGFVRADDDTIARCRNALAEGVVDATGRAGSDPPEFGDTAG